MADKTKTIKVVVDAKSADRALEVLRGNFKATADVIKATGDTADKTMKDIKKSVESTESSLGFLQRAFKAAFVINAISTFGQQLYDINSKFQGFIATMTVVTGSVAESRKEFDFITNVANKYGVSIQSLTGTYAKLAAAGKDSALTHSDLHKIFEAMAMASNVLHLSMEETRLVFYALQQMVSKGNVTMEELRRQLAEKFPGAVNLMAEALEVPVKELERMIKSGQVAADQALPKFAEAVMRAFGSASQYAVKSLNAEVTRLHNAWFTFIQTMAEKSNILTAIIEVVNWLTKSLNDNGSAAVAIGNQIGNMIKIVGDWVKSLTAEDVSSFFKTVENALAAIIPFLQLGAAALAGWGMILKPLVAQVSELGRMMAEEKWSDGLLRLAKLLAAGTGNQSLAMWIDGLEKSMSKTATTAHRFIGIAPQVSEVAEETGKYGKSLEDQLKSLDKEYIASIRSIQVKTKQRDATKELMDAERERQGLLEVAQGSGFSEEARIKAYRLLIAGEKDYIALQKEATQERKASSNAYNQLLQPALSYIQSLEREAAGLSYTQAQIDELNKKEMLRGLTLKDQAILLEKMAKAQEWVNAARADEAARKETDKRVKDAQQELADLDLAIKKQIDYNFALGKTKEQVRLYEIAQLEAALAVAELNYVVDENSKLSMAEYELLGQKITRLKELISLRKDANIKETEIEETNKNLKESNTLWKDLDRYTDKFFLDLIVKGKDAFTSLRNDLKLFAAELLSLAAKRFIFNIVGNMIGGSTGAGMTGIAANAGANTVAGRALDWGGNALATSLGYSAMGGFGELSAGYIAQSAFLAGTAESAAVAGTLAGEIGAALAAIPVWGWIAAAVLAIGVWVSGRGGGPKTGGSSFATYDSEGRFIGNASVTNPTENGQLLSETGANADARSLSDAWSKGFSATLKKFGATTTGFGAGLAFNSDPQGDAPSMVRGQLQMGGRTVFDFQNSNVDDKDVGKELGLMMKRMTIAGLQNSDLPESLKNIFNSINAETATEEQIDKVMKYAEAFQHLIDLTGEFTDTQLKAVEYATSSAWEMYGMQGDALEELANSFDGSEASMLALTAATEEYRKTQYNLLVDIKKIAKELDKLFASTRRSIEMGGLTNEEKYTYIQKETDRLIAQLQVATDPAEIQRLSGLIDSNMREAYGMLSPEQQISMKTQFLASLDFLEQLVNERLTAARDSILGDNADNPDSPLAVVATKLTEFADAIVPAGANIRDGGNAILAASGRPVTVVVVPGGGDSPNEGDSPINGG